MRILAIDTATMVTSVCLWEDHKIIGDYSVNQAKTHSESLMQMSEQLLKDLNLTYEDMDVFAVSKGPGSFTGLRIGITTAKTLAQVTGKPLVGISTLEALAYNVFSDKPVLAVMDARGGRVYAGLYKKGQQTGLKPDLYQCSDLVLKLKAMGEPIVVVGEGWQTNLKLFEEMLFDKTPAPFNNCIARSIAQLAYERYRVGDWDDWRTLAPDYYRKSQAQRDLEAKGTTR